MLSHLQHFILEECLGRGGGCSRRALARNDERANPSRAEEINYQKILTQSIERLISRGLLIGYGSKTQKKLFIDRIRLTAKGRRLLQKTRQDQQPKLPIR